MKKNLRVIQINGIRGLFLAFFIVTCLIAGFVAFPAFVTKFFWNYLSLRTGSFPAINFSEALLLWAIVSFSVYLFNKRKFIVSFNSQQELSEDEVNAMVSRVKTQAMKNSVIMPKEFNIENEIKDEVEFSDQNKN